MRAFRRAGVKLAGATRVVVKLASTHRSCLPSGVSRPCGMHQLGSAGDANERGGSCFYEVAFRASLSRASFYFCRLNSVITSRKEPTVQLVRKEVVISQQHYYDTGLTWRILWRTRPTELRNSITRRKVGWSCDWETCCWEGRKPHQTRPQVSLKAFDARA